MAQTSSAAREPSMEEILASIRRIIEDSDVVRQPLAVPVKSPPKGEVTEFPRAVSPVAFQPEPVDNPKNSGDFDDIRSLHSDVANAAEEIVNPYVSHSAGLDEGVPIEAPAAVEFEDSIETSVEYTHISETFIEEARASASFDQSLEHSIEDQSNEFPTEQAIAAHEDVVEVADSGSKIDVGGSMTSSTRSILSEATERQVASAFKDLNHAVHSGPLRSFDEIATELLQPMLADWMENNLSSLVERLVREEIQRIVRGEK